MTVRQLMSLLVGRDPDSRVRVATPDGSLGLRADLWVTACQRAPDLLLVPAALSVGPDPLADPDDGPGPGGELTAEVTVLARELAGG